MVMEQKMELRGSAGELLRSAVTPYIQNLSESHFPCHNDKIVDLWKMIIGKNMIEISLCTQGHLTKKFPKFLNPIVNLDFHAKTDPGLSWVSNDR